MKKLKFKPHPTQQALLDYYEENPKRIFVTKLDRYRGLSSPAAFGLLYLRFRLDGAKEE